MQSQHRSHLLSTESTIREHLAAIRKVVTTGESPGGGRSRPLAVTQREPLLAALEGVEASLAGLVRGLLPEASRDGVGSQGAGGARVWASILLRTVADLVRDLSPEVMERRYGRVDPAAATTLGEGVPRLPDEIERGLALLR
jgi:hypothetical protein